jgi:hypothetical protein
LASELANLETIEINAVMEHWLHLLQQRLRENPDQNLAQKIRGVMRTMLGLDQNAT